MTTGSDSRAADLIGISIGVKTKYVISTSGRLKSLKRYNNLLQTVLRVDCAYIPYSNNSDTDDKVDPLLFSNTLRSLNCIGGAISKDVKSSIIPYLDSLDPSAEATQSVNTVVVVLTDQASNKKHLIGYNTDYTGFKACMVDILNKADKKINTCIIYGYGGVTLTAISVLKELGITVYITGRRVEEAEKRAKELNVHVFKPDLHLKCCLTFGLFVNAAPISSISDLSTVDNFLDALLGSACHTVFDHELDNKSLEHLCLQRGITYYDGNIMYYPQMYEQWVHFLNRYDVNKDNIKGYIDVAIDNTT